MTQQQKKIPWKLIIVLPGVYFSVYKIFGISKNHYTVTFFYLWLIWILLVFKHVISMLFIKETIVDGENYTSQ